MAARFGLLRHVWHPNLLAQLGDYATAGQKEISLVNADSFCVDGHFEETIRGPIRVGDPVEIKLMGYREIVPGHVGRIARAINVANAQPNEQGVATVNPIFTWVRLAQRTPVRIHIDQVPQGVVLAAGMTATVPGWRVGRVTLLDLFPRPLGGRVGGPFDVYARCVYPE